jgi:hypothetical protein
MKRTASLGLLLSMVLTGTGPLIAQRKIDGGTKQKLVRDTDFESVTAISDGAGALVRWQMTTEVSAVGYNVYRLDGGSRVKINPAIIPGSARSQKGVVAFAALRQYFDVDGRVGSGYVIESLKTDGSRTISGSATTTSVASLESEVGTSSETFRQALLSANHSVENRTPNLTSDLSDLVAAYAAESNPAVQRVVASKAGAKIAVKKDGFYRVTAAELQAANFQLNSDPAKWRLFANGVEQAIIVAPDRSYIEFYGRGVDLPETDSQIYFLVADTVPGKRIATRLLRTVPGSTTARNFKVTAETRDRREYNPELFNGDDENFLGDLFDTNPARPVRFNLSGIDFSQPTATIKVSLFGHLETGSHRVLPKINGFDLPAMVQFGRVFYSESFVIPTTQLLEGENQLELASATNGDYNIFDKVEVTYKRNFQAEAGKLSFFTPGSKRVELDGFATPSVRVFDTTFEGNPVLLAGLQTEEGSSGYQVRIPATRMMVGYAVEDTAVLQSPSVTPNVPSTLSLATNGADMLIISHSAPSFLNAAETWAAYRRSGAGGGFNVRVVDVADVFDEFNYGLSSADAIKGFLAYTQESWATHPRYVLLLGDSSYDPRNYEGQGNFNFVPSRSAVYIDDESFSDELLGDFDGDDVSSVSIGRIPARTPEQIATAFSKMMKFESNQLNFSRGAVFANDAPLGYDFAGLNQQLASRLPQGTPVDTVGATEAGASSNLITAFNRGRFLVNYSGHGASSFWSGSGFLQSASIPQLINSENPSIVTMMTCLSGHFAQNRAVSLAEALVFSDAGGAAATWASTGSTTADIQSVMAEKFFQGLSAPGPKRLGDTIRVAKGQTPSGRDVKLSWALLGDPAMKTP